MKFAWSIGRSVTHQGDIGDLPRDAQQHVHKDLEFVALRTKGDVACGLHALLAMQHIHHPKSSFLMAYESVPRHF